MSLTSIVFSRDRPAQLDLLLRSMKQNAPAFLKTRPRIIVRATDDAFEAGYLKLRAEHSATVPFLIWEEDEGARSFHELFLNIFRAGTGDKVAFFVDDDVIYRPLPVAHPSKWLDLFPDTLCFSLRLGRNTTQCYPLGGIRQEDPVRLSLGDFDVWRWRGAAADFGYPASLDGHIFRRDDVLAFLDGAEYANPNQLEEALVRGVHRNDMWRQHIAAFKESVLVGVPVNSVSETHATNRHSELFLAEPAWLNADYLAGRRLAFPLRGGLPIAAAHVELPLLWEDE